MRRQLRKRLVRSAAVVVAGLILMLGVETLSYLFFTIPVKQIQNRVYIPPKITPREFDEYIANRDPILGWPAKPKYLGSRINKRNARISPSNQRMVDLAPCISVYGDSMTYGLGVEDKETWADKLARSIDCPVENFGVNGYGVDQAVLRFATNELDKAPYTILGIYTDDLNRNMNQWRYLIRSPHTLLFKPTFSLDKNGEIKIEQIPVNDYETFLRTAKDPGINLSNDYFDPKSNASCASRLYITFPYTIAIFRFGVKLVRCRFFPQLFTDLENAEYFPTWFDTANGPSKEKVYKNLIILRYFYNTCRKKAKKCFVMFFPDSKTLKNMQEFGSNFLEMIYTDYPNFVKVWDPINSILKNAKDSNPCNIFIRPDACAGHYNEHGYDLVSCFVSRKLTALPKFPLSNDTSCNALLASD